MSTLPGSATEGSVARGADREGEGRTTVSASHAAVQRLEASRERLRAHLLPPPQAEAEEDSDPPLPSSRALRRWLLQARRWVAGTPLAPLVVPAWEAACLWWQGQAWHGPIVRVGRKLERDVRPWVRRHPGLAIGVAAALGAALVWLRPWRWRAVPAPAPSGVHRGAGSVLRSVIHLLSQPWVQTALATAFAAWAEERARAKEADGAPAPPLGAKAPQERGGAPAAPAVDPLEASAGLDAP